jgi:hypothetical protein
MFFHYTGQFKLIVPLRCATNSLHDYLGYTHRQTYYDHDLAEFRKGDCVRAVVLRHPFERYHSACALMPDQLGSQEWAWHFAPFLHDLDQVAWHYIPFEQLGLYAASTSARTVVRSVVNCSLTEADYVANPYITYQQLVEEVELYHKALRTRSRLSVLDWHRLTARSV